MVGGDEDDDRVSLASQGIIIFSKLDYDFESKSVGGGWQRKPEKSRNKLTLNLK